MSKLRWQNENGEIELVEVNQQWLNKHDEQIRADERAKIIDELHKELEMQIRENPKIIYVDNKDYLSVARGSVLQVIHETLKQLKEHK